MAQNTNFHVELDKSNSDIENKKQIVKQIMAQKFHDITTVEQSTVAEDMKGTDFLVYQLNRKKPIRVDVKWRDYDALVKRHVNDLCLEIYSSVESKTPGWTVDLNKDTEWVIYYWNSTRFFILNYRMLRETAIANKRKYLSQYRMYPDSSTNNNYGGVYHTRCVAVPVEVLMTDMFGGYLTPPEEED